MIETRGAAVSALETHRHALRSAWMGGRGLDERSKARKLRQVAC